MSSCQVRVVTVKKILKAVLSRCEPDFIAEIETCLYMFEPKARNEMNDGEVQAKKDTAVRWCYHATVHATKNGGRPWKYLLIPHDAIAENMTIADLASQFSVS